jgi:MoxR-like ATPase
MNNLNEWRIYKGSGEPHDAIRSGKFPKPPKWRYFDGKIDENKDEREAAFAVDPSYERRFSGNIFVAGEQEKDLINSALLLRRPLLVTGKPGGGKSSLAFAVAHELRLGHVLVWSVTSRSTLRDALYRYDAVGRLQETQLLKEGESADIGRYVRLGTLGTAFLPARYPRVLLIDEIDKSDIDLPNDLLTIFEEGEFVIPELARLEQKEVNVYTDDGDIVTVTNGRVRCNAFPFVVLTSNGEREFPGPFLRRCLRLDIKEPSPEKLAQIVNNHFGDLAEDKRNEVVRLFLARRTKGDLATDQLLNALYLTSIGVDLDVTWEPESNLDSTEADKGRLIDVILKYLNTMEAV